MYSLFLYDTSNQKKQYTESALNAYLQHIGLIKNIKNTLAPDEAFMFLITFLGCSPNIQLEIKTEITTLVNSNVLAYGGDSIEKIICPMCKKNIKEPSRLISNYSNKTIWISNCCQNNIDIKDINWRKSAGFSQSFIQISNIFPKEAIPSEQLLNLLSKFSQSTWNYFYSKQQKI